MTAGVKTGGAALRGCLPHPGSLPEILDVVDGLRDVREHDGTGGSVGDHQLLVIVRLEQLIVGRDRVSLPAAVEIAFGLIHVGGHDGRAEILEIQSSRQQLGRVDPHAHAGLLSAADAHHADARLLCNLLCEPCLSQVFHLGQRHRGRAESQCQNRRVGRIGLVIDRRVGQVGGKIGRRRIDRLLHLLFGHVDIERQRELQDDDRTSIGAGRRHLVEAGHLAELALQGAVTDEAITSGLAPG